MSKSSKKPVFLEPAELPGESNEEALQRLAAVLKTLGIEVVEDRPNIFPNQNVSSGKPEGNFIPNEDKKDTENDA